MRRTAMEPINRACFLHSAALGLVIIQSLISFGFAQIFCSNPLKMGELRVFKSKQCVDIAGDDGSGNVETYDCDGLQDQEIIICGDGTIRNQLNNYCLQPDGSGIANVVSDPCTLLPNIPSRQRWRLGRRKTFIDTGGIEQTATEIINIESSKCLDVSNTDGTGNIGTYHCTNQDDQYFYIRSRGRELHYGRLQNERSNHCLDVAKYTGMGDVAMYNCEDQADQFFRFYENGEIVNERSKWCLDVAGHTGNGNILTHPCEDLQDQMWQMPTAYCDGDYCSFVNVKSRKCLDVAGYRGTGDVSIYDCELLSDQRFKWVAGTWETPTASWVNVGCNQNGQVSQEITNTVSFESSIETSLSIEISATIGAEVKFLNVEVSTTVSTSLSQSWTHSREESSTIGLTCEYYDSGEDFTGGCMWQLQLEMTQVRTGQLLVWKPQIVKCTHSNVEPKCPPFTKCTDEDCNFCEEF